MASSKNGVFSTGLSIVAVLLIAYLAYKWLMAPKQASAAANGLAAGSPMASYGALNGPAPGNPFATLLGRLLGGQGNPPPMQKPGIGGMSVGGGGGSYPSIGGLPYGLQSAISAITNYNSMANNMPLAELGGQSLATYDPLGSLGNDIGLQSSYAPYQILQGITQPIDWGSFGGSNGLSTTSVDLGSLPSDPTQSFDAGQMSAPIDFSSYSDPSQSGGF